MKLCKCCKQPVEDPAFLNCAACRAKSAAYVRAWKLDYFGPPRISLPKKALAWIRAAPRSTREIAALLGIHPRQAASLIGHLKRFGWIEGTAPIKQGGAENWYRIKQL